MATYTNNLNLYKPSRLDDDIQIDTSLATNFQNIEDKIGIALQGGYNDLGERFNGVHKDIAYKMGENLRKYGAVGDGVTDDTQALADVADYVYSNGGGVVYVPAGDYVIDGRVELRGDITFIADRGAIFRKADTSTTPHVFTCGMQYGQPGYGGGAQNLGFYNLVFKGLAVDDTTYKALANTFHHAQNVVFNNCYFTDCITSAHALDLAGCDGVLVEDCWFIGAYHIAGREYTEAIQIDSSAEGALGDPAFTNYDGLPTKNVTVRGSRFVPSYNVDGTVKNYAPNPIGNHGFTGGNPYTNIVFDSNVVYDGWAKEGGWRAWLHFYGLADSRITNNQFIVTREVDCTPIGLYTSSGGRYDPVTGASGTGAPLPIANVQVEGNTFRGFSGATSALIRVYGSTYNSLDYKVSGIDLKKNKFFDCGDPNATEGTGTNLIQVNKYRTLDISGNEADAGGRLVSVYDGSRLKIYDNESDNMAINAIYVSSTKVLKIANNIGENVRRPLEISESGRGVIVSNVYDGVLQTGADTHANQLRNLHAVTIQSNVASTDDPDITYGYYVYDTDGTSDSIKMYDNMAYGFPTDVNQTGTITNYQYRG